MKKIIIGIFILAAIVSLSAAATDGSKTISTDNNTAETAVNISQLDTSKPVATFEDGKLYMAGNLKVLDLHGSYRNMGRQYGALMKDDLNKMYNTISADFGKKPGVDYDGFLKIGRYIYQSNPQRYREIINGVADTSGLGLDKELIVSSIEWSYIRSRWGCSALVAWDNYTSGDPLVFGRNYDYGSPLADYVSAVIYNPDDGSLPVASVTYTGCIYVTTGMNDKGLFLELNTGGPSLTVDYSNKIFAPATLFSFLEESQNLEQLDMQFHTSYPQSAYLISVANQTGAYCYEWEPSDVKRRAPDRDGLLVSTNHFVDPSWGINPIGDTFQLGQNVDVAKTKERRANLLALGEKYKGNFTPETMMKVMSIPIANGGAFMINRSTSYQIVAVPKDIKMWVRVPEYQDWVEIDLKSLFS